MFTGIVNGTLKINSIEPKENNFLLKIAAKKHLTNNLKTGDSVAINGCCLTVAKILSDEVFFDIIPETSRRTNIAQLKANDLVNYERSAKFSDEINGHMVSGHIHDTGTVISVDNPKDFGEKKITIQYDHKWDKYIFQKGFISVNGCSLTVGKKTNNCFCIYLIPETLRTTTFNFIKTKDIVNLELDNQTVVTVDTVYNIMQEQQKTATHN